MYIVRIFKTRPRLAIAVAVGLAAFSVLELSTPLNAQTAGIIALNTAQIFFLILFVSTMHFSNLDKVKKYALQQDDGKNLILALVLGVAGFTLASLILELHDARSSPHRDLHLLLAFISVASAWLFSHTMFAVHYAHEYYSNMVHKKEPGLKFPDSEPPDYYDFLYFSFIIGTSAQTADVSYSCKSMRKIGLLHCTFSYIFNTAILALAINIAAGFLT